MSNNELVLLRRIEELEKLVYRQPEIGGVWQDWTPTVYGWSAITDISSSYAVVGNLCFMRVRLDGTSNANTFSCDLPIQAGAVGQTTVSFSGLGVNGGTLLTDPCGIIIESEGTVVNFTKGVTSSTNTWATSGRKYIGVQFFYFI